jgi:putative transposase
MLATLIVILRLPGVLCRGHRAVALENFALRQQLAALTRTRKRSQVRTDDRLFWVCLASGWRGWRAALIVVHPDTVVRWHRQWLRRLWTRRSARGRSGRPSTTTAIRALVTKIAASRLVRRPRRPPSQTWRTFLTNHVTALGSIDFFSVPAITGRVLFVFVVLLHHRRRILHFNVTEHPTAAWTAQEMRQRFAAAIGTSNS